MKKIEQTVREEISKELWPSINKKRKKMKAIGKYPYDGKWLSVEEIQGFCKKIKRSDKVIFFEIILIFLLIGMVSYVFYMFIIFFLLPQ